jgi:hypothetical protein
LSTLGYDPATKTFWSLSDDRGARDQVRAYRIRLTLTDEAGKVKKEPEVRVEQILRIANLDGRPFQGGAIDPEGMAHRSDGSFFFSTEPILTQGIPALIALGGPDGRLRREITLPAHCRPGAGRGIRENLGFEGLALSPSGRFLFAGLEDAEEQDGPIASPSAASPSRIFRFDLEKGEARSEFVYVVEPVSTPSIPQSGYLMNGLSDFVVLSDTRLFTLERQFVQGVGNTVRIFDVSLDGATDVSALDSLSGASWVPATKTLLLDLSELGIPLDNYEGMSFGPDLPDGRGTLVLVTDDNFNSLQESTTFLVLAVDRAPATISRIQGPSHRSPLEGTWVLGVEGVVTAIDKDPRFPGFWMESAVPDGDGRTSEGLFVQWPKAASLSAGASVRVNGKVEEWTQPKGLGLTRLRATSLAMTGTRMELPPPVKLFTEVQMPKVVTADNLGTFDPARSALDLWESLEGMRVEIPGGTVVGPSSRRGDITLRPDGASDVQRTSRGGVRLASQEVSLERAFLSPRVARSASVDVGAKVKGPITGLVDYSGSNYRLQVLAPFSVERDGPVRDEATALSGDKKHLTFATFNVENLSIAVEPERMPVLGQVVVNKLRNPDVIVLEEVQDDSGPAKGDGVVTSMKTLEALTGAIAGAGGPRYEAVWIDPQEGKEGGQPGGNIRVAFLVNTARVELVRRGKAGPLDATEPLGKGKAVHLSLSPGRVVPGSAAFSLGEGEGVRRSLAIELRFAGKSVFVIGNHLSSKTDDDRVFGSVQPPRFPTADRRLAQAREIRSFVERLLAADPRARVVVLGDMNDFEYADAILALARPPLENLVLRVPEEDRYTFNFEGTSGVLDHIVVSPAVAKAAEIDFVHINSDMATPKRASDHDPIVVRLAIP